MNSAYGSYGDYFDWVPTPVMVYRWWTTPTAPGTDPAGRIRTDEAATLADAGVGVVQREQPVEPSLLERAAAYFTPAAPTQQAPVAGTFVETQTPVRAMGPHCEKYDLVLAADGSCLPAGSTAPKAAPAWQPFAITSGIVVVLLGLLAFGLRGRTRRRRNRGR
jgi:hypothetical protein